MNARTTIGIATAAALIGLGGCAANPTNQQVGLGAGAAIGGVAGNAIFGNTVGTVGGAAAGALIGNEIGRRKDDREQQRYEDDRYDRSQYRNDDRGYDRGYYRR